MPMVVCVKSRLVAAAAVVGALVSPFLTAPAQAAGNDYPYRTDATQSADPWGFTKRQCVSFAAWELKQRGHPISNRGNAWGSAYHWDETARSKHVTITTRPKVGAIAQWNSNERSKYYPSGGGTGYLQAGANGHVAVVIRVYSDQSVVIEQYNISGNRNYSTMHVKAPRYLYIAG
jgi:surface antigen